MRDTTDLDLKPEGSKAGREAECSIGHAFRGPDQDVPPLSRRLRPVTAGLHREAERALDVPASISDRASYAATLGVFYGLYAPLERALAMYSDWYGLGLDLGERRQSDRLAADLATLGVQPCGNPAPGCRWLNSFPRALGALYVLEGSTLGGRIILRQLQDQDIGIPVGAMTFFGGHGAKTGAMWLSLGAVLDTFGARHEDLQSEVEQGACLMFRAIISGFQQHGHQSYPQ